MKFINLFILCAMVGLSAACTKSATMSPLQAAGCDVEGLGTSAAASAIASVLSCSNAPQIQADLQVALGNVNFCAVDVPAASVASLVAGAKKYSKLGDVSAADVAAAKAAKPGLVKSEAVKPMGIVGNIACPLIFNVGIGYLTQAVPSGWSCAASASTASVSQALITACEAAIPL